MDMMGGAQPGVSSQGLGNEALFPAGGMTDSDTLASMAGAGGGGMDSSGLAEKLKLAATALQGAQGPERRLGMGGSPGGGGVRMGTMPTMSSLDNLVRILQRQQALGAGRQRRQGSVFD